MRPLLTRVRSTLVAITGIVAVSLICYYLIHVNATIAATVLLLCALVSGVYQKLTEAVIASVTATLCLDYFFVPPIGSISIGDPQGWILLVVFLAVSLIVTHLSRSLRKQRDELILRQTEAEKLYALSRSMLLSDGEDVRRLIVNKCMELFGFTEMVLFEKATGQFYRSQTETWIPEEKLQRAPLYAEAYRSESGHVIMPITLGNKNLGSFAFRGVSLSEGTLQGIGNTVAVGLAQAQAQEAGSRAEAVRKSEELKSVMIDAIAHDLKTPLTAIEAAADMLLPPADVAAEQRDDLLHVIQEESRGLRRMMDEAIHLARIDAKKLRLEYQSVSIRDLISAALQLVGDRALSHEIEVDVPENLPPVLADSELLVQALKQLLDNALKYSPSRSVITISAAAAQGVISISVHDEGQGLTELEQGRVFDKFYRGRYDRSAVQGTGMGLAIAREIVEAHGGHIGVESQIGQGSRFTIGLSSAPKAEEMEPQEA
ncbi:MAG: DUF4118 domain-containing protein [Acidobacteriaceae bacterium]|nr:DUF4118 domain-containing protein [Acidobacteriaceae bacterium]